jgi:putative endonuclease
MEKADWSSVASPDGPKGRSAVQALAIDARYFVYILASRRNGTLYVGLTNNLGRWLEEHRAGIASRFTAKYGVTRLVYFERHESIEVARDREYRLKRWRRTWKLALIEESNPDWDDLAEAIGD